MAVETRPISSVLQAIAENIQDILRGELRLAKSKVSEELGKARAAGVLFGVGAAMAIFSAVFLLLAMVYALSLVLPAWAASLIVAAAVGVVAIVALRLGTKRFQTIRGAPGTAASMKENVEWAKELTK